MEERSGWLIDDLVEVYQVRIIKRRGGSFLVYLRPEKADVRRRSSLCRPVTPRVCLL